MFSRTTDGGATWSTPVPMRQSNAFFQGNQIAVGPDGTLYNVVANLFTGAGVQPNGRASTWASCARGRRPALVGAGADRADPDAQLVVPDDDFPIRAGDYLPDIAIDPNNGAIYVVWSDGLGTPINRVVMAKSTDGGRHWSGPTVVSAGGPNVQAYNHAIEVTADGTVVLTYYDDRNNVPGRRRRHHRRLAAPLARRRPDLGAGAAPPRAVRPLPGADLVLRAGRPARPVPRRLHGPGDDRGRRRDRLLRLDDRRRRGRPRDPRDPPVGRDLASGAARAVPLVVATAQDSRWMSSTQ